MLAVDCLVLTVGCEFHICCSHTVLRLEVADGLGGAKGTVDENCELRGAARIKHFFTD
jgi:hypothetical protein